MAVYPVPPSFNQALVYNVQLDGNSYNVRIYYQPFGQRLYYQINDQVGNLIVNAPLISAISRPNLLTGYFTTSTMSYSSVEQIMTILP